MKHPLFGGLIGLAFGLLGLWATVGTLRSGKVYGGRGRTGSAHPRKVVSHVLVSHVVYVVITFAIFAITVRRLLLVNGAGVFPLTRQVTP